MRKAGRLGWNLWRALIGVGYLAAAGFNSFFTLPHGNLEWFADGAWSPFLADFVRNVVHPHREPLLALVVAFEVAVGILILHRGRAVDIGAGAAVLWVLLLMPFLQPWPMATTNLGLAAVQGIILLRRYDAAVWELGRKAP